MEKFEITDEFIEKHIQGNLDKNRLIFSIQKAELTFQFQQFMKDVSKPKYKLSSIYHYFEQKNIPLKGTETVDLKVDLGKVRATFDSDSCLLEEVSAGRFFRIETKSLTEEAVEQFFDHIDAVLAIIEQDKAEAEERFEVLLAERIREEKIEKLNKARCQAVLDDYLQKRKYVSHVDMRSDRFTVKANMSYGRVLEFTDSYTHFSENTEAVLNELNKVFEVFQTLPKDMHVKIR